MSAWPVTPLSDVIELQRGHDLPTPARTAGPVPIIGSFGITGSHDQAAYDGPGVAIGRSGASIGTATFVAEPYWPLNTCLFVRDFKGNDPRWVFHLLHSTDFTSFNSGSAQPSLNRNFLRSIPVSLPPVGEQRAIAEVLGTLDDKIAANAKLVDAAARLSVAMLAELPPSVPLGDVVVHHKETVSPVDFGPSEVTHFSLPAFDAGQHIEVVDPVSIMSSKFAIRQPGVLVSKLNPRFPRNWDVPTVPSSQAFASTEFLVLESKHSSSSVLWALLSQPSFKTSLESKVSGTSGSHQRVRPADLLDTQVADPRLVTGQQQSAIRAIGLRIASCRQESQSLAVVRDALLPLLMSGKLRVRDAEKRVGEVV